jgi:shikimate kinase
MEIFEIKKPIVLVGLMGSGKSTIGYRLAKKLRLSFVDTDNLVEERVGCSISEMYKYAGEQFFNEKEKEILQEVLKDKPCVISTGGGTFAVEENRKLILEKAVSVWLKADYSIILERVSRRNTRPLLEVGDKAETIKALIEERYPIYGLADIHINSDEGPHMIIVDGLIQKLKCLNK